ncbi:MAG: class C sortase [Blautia sp.]|nr:class C sortase [Blautia sp.]
MKKFFLYLLISVMFLGGFGIFAYPAVANMWNNYRQRMLIHKYTNVVDTMEPEDFSQIWEEARAYNDTITENDIYGDTFGDDSYEDEEENTGINPNAASTGIIDSETASGEETQKEKHLNAYYNVLNLSEEGIMGYIQIPKINIQLSIYHGVKDEVLLTGVGHLSGTKLPIGGESNHSVLAAHRGLPNAKLFTDIDQLEEGDEFYIHILDETMAYKVDQILPMVDKDDDETLQAAMRIVQGEDLVTLFTCTPYGVNTHRLLVRGTRVPYTEEAKKEVERQRKKEEFNIMIIYAVMIPILSVLILGLLIATGINNRKHKKSKNKSKSKKKSTDQTKNKSKTKNNSKTEKGPSSAKASVPNENKNKQKKQTGKDNAQK